MENEFKKIKESGKSIEDILNQENLDPFIKNVIRISLKFGYAVGQCEKKYEQMDDPYLSYDCVEKYEKIIKILQEKNKCLKNMNVQNTQKI